MKMRNIGVLESIIYRRHHKCKTGKKSWNWGIHYVKIGKYQNVKDDS
jgi:hypothetical protein